MGQQQLLLVILVTIIVGIATVVAINIFGTAADQANRDAVRQDLMAASVQAQAVWSRPALMNGADRNFSTYVSNNSNGELLALLNIPNTDTDFDPTSDTEITNENGTYSIQSTGERSITIRGVPSSGGTGEYLQAAVQRDATTGNWSVTITDEDGSSSSSGGGGGGGGGGSI